MVNNIFSKSSLNILYSLDFIINFSYFKYIYFKLGNKIALSLFTMVLSNRACSWIYIYLLITTNKRIEFWLSY